MSSLGHARRARAWRWWALALLTFALLPCLGYLAAELYLLDGGLGMPLDDSFIHLQFARNLAAGDGLAYNPGERVTGSTAPLWTAVLSLGFLLPGNPLAWAKAIGVACHLLAVLASFHLARALAVPPRLAGLAAGLVAATSWLVWSSLAAMEVPLFTALAVAGIALHVRERRDPGAPPLSLPLLALSVLARPEGLLLLALAVVDRLALPVRCDGELVLEAPAWRRLGEGLLLAALALLPMLLVYYALGGSALPTTFSTKAGYGAPGLPQSRYLFEVWGIFVQAQPVATLLAPAGALVLLRRLGSDDDPGLLAPLWAIALPLAYGVLSGGGKGIFGNFGRYFFPLFPVVVVLGVVALVPLVERLPGRLRIGRVAIAWPLLLAPLLLLPTLLALVYGAGRYTQSVLNVEDGDVHMARLLGEVLPPEALLAVNDIGALKYYLPNRVLDLAGIATPEVHAYARRAFAETGSYCPGLLAFVRERRPDYLAVFPGWHGCFGRAEFPELLRVEVAANITLGEDRIVLLATPWSRYPLRPRSTTPPPGPGAPNESPPGPPAGG